MTIDEAIAEFKERAEDSKKISELGMKSYIPKAKEEKQLVEWLEELKDYQNKNKMVVRVDVENMDSIKDKIDELSKYAESQYNKAIDDLSNKICMHFADWKYSEDDKCIKDIIELASESVEEIAEQLKSGGENEQSI